MNETTDAPVNEGYEIIKTDTYRVTASGRTLHSIVLGKQETKLGDKTVTQYVTWDSDHTLREGGQYEHNYYWGHYFFDRDDAYADFHERLREKYAGHKNNGED